MDVAIYVRVSTQEQKLHGISVDAQEAFCRDWVQEQGHRLVGVYNDAGLSARAGYKKRSAMLRLIDDIQAGKVELIVFTKLDRWFRNVADYYEVQSILERHDVKWRALQEDYETETASGRFKVNIMLAVAQDEADRTSERIKAAADYKRAKGEAVGRAPVGYKIENKRFVIDPETEPGIRAFFDAYLSTLSASAAMRAAREHGIIFNLTRSNRTLRNRTYCGDHFGVPCPAYITEDQYQLIRQNTAKHSRNRKTGRVYIFSGLLRCGYCGGAMTSATTPQRTGDGVIKYYRCSNHVQKLDACPNGMHANEKKLETYLLATLDRKLQEYVHALACQQASQTDHVEEIRRLQGRLARLKELYIDGDVSKDDYQARSTLLKNEIAALDVVPEMPEVPVLPDGWQETYSCMTDSGKRAFWAKTIKSIVISRDEPDIKF